MSIYGCFLSQLVPNILQFIGHFNGETAGFWGNPIAIQPWSTLGAWGVPNPGGDSKEPYPGGSRWVCHRCVIGVKFSYGWSLEPIGLGHDFTLLLWLGLDITREGWCSCCSDFGFPWYHIVKKHIFSPRTCHKMSNVTRDSLLVQNEGNLHPNLPFNHLLRDATWSKFKTPPPTKCCANSSFLDRVYNSLSSSILHLFLATQNRTFQIPIPVLGLTSPQNVSKLPHGPWWAVVHFRRRIWRWRGPTRRCRSSSWAWRSNARWAWSQSTGNLGLPPAYWRVSWNMTFF